MKFAVYFRTKLEDNFPSPFRKARLPRHDKNSGKCFVTIIEEETETEKRAWDCIFTCCPDYSEAGINKIEKVRNPEKSSEMIDETLEMIVKRNG